VKSVESFHFTILTLNSVFVIRVGIVKNQDPKQKAYILRQYPREKKNLIFFQSMQNSYRFIHLIEAQVNNAPLLY